MRITLLLPSVTKAQVQNVKITTMEMEMRRYFAVYVLQIDDRRANIAVSKTQEKNPVIVKKTSPQQQQQPI